MGKILNKFIQGFRGHKEWWADYMTEISILIISLAATFYGENLISNYMDAQDDKETVGIVVNEIRENLSELNDLEQYYDNNIHFSSLLRRYLSKKETISADTLNLFYNHHRRGIMCYFKDNAFNMMKNSGFMLRIDDKELLSKIFETYDRMYQLKGMDEYFKQEHTAACNLFLSELDEDEDMSTTVKQWKKIGENKKFRQYLFVAYPTMCKSRKAVCTLAKKLMEDIVIQLEQAYPQAN